MKKKILLVLIFLLIGLSLLFIVNRHEKEIVEEYKDFEVYFSTKDAMFLEAELRQLAIEDIFVDAIKHLIKGPESIDLSRTIPDGVELIDIDIRSNVAYINFNRALIENHWGGSAGEILTVYSIVNTMTGFPDIDAVNIMIEGNKLDSLSGHLDLSEPIERDESIIQK
ncbi:GerMN domain-containing protein [Natronospora cellulosivora (SeqCode)]